MNISLVSDFLIKLMKLPLGFFDIKLIGDILQRITDQRRVENLLTSSSLNIMFSLFNLLVFGIVLAIYSWKILLLFVIGSSLYFIWLSIFMRRRRELDFKRFSNLSENQSKLIQLISGVQDIKLYHAERQKRWEWENIQGSLFKVNIRSLALTQYQEAGGVFINEAKNILITFLAATMVIHNQMTLGMMLAVSYILGQLNSPIEQMIHFLHVTQDARISMERLGEIHKEENEEKEDREGMIVMPETRTLDVRGRCQPQDPGRPGDGHRRGERERQDDPGQTPAGLLPARRGRDPGGGHPAAIHQSPALAQAMRRGHAGRVHFLGHHCPECGPGRGVHRYGPPAGSGADGQH
jgi:ATP-binding cassette subfamily B protein